MYDNASHKRLANLNGVLFRHGANAVQQVRERIAPEILGHDVGPAALFLHGNKFQYVGMVQTVPDLFLSLEPGVKAGIALKLHKRNLHRDGLFCLQVSRLENSRHAAAADGLGDEKTVVEGLPGLEFVAGCRVRPTPDT